MTTPMSEPYQTTGPDAGVADDSVVTDAYAITDEPADPSSHIPVHDEPGEALAVPEESGWMPLSDMKDREIAEETLSHLRQLQDLLNQLQELDPMELMQKLMSGNLFG